MITSLESDFEEEVFWSEFGMKNAKNLKPQAGSKIKIAFEEKKSELEPPEKQRKEEQTWGSKTRETEGKPVVNDRNTRYLRQRFSGAVMYSTAG